MASWERVVSLLCAMASGGCPLARIGRTARPNVCSRGPTTARLSLFRSTPPVHGDPPDGTYRNSLAYEVITRYAPRRRIGRMSRLPAPSVVLDDQLCFALYAASRAVTARYRPMLDELGLTYPQYLVMMLLWEKDDQTVGQLGSKLALDSGTLSPLLKRLTAAGLVTRHRRVEDERSVSISLTEEGRALRERALPISESMIGAIGFDTSEFDDLKSRLRVLVERVNDGGTGC